MPTTAERLSALEAKAHTHAATPTPAPVPTPVLGYLVISVAELAARPTSGAAWDAMNAAATATWPAPGLVNQDSTHQCYVLAAALVSARNGSASLRSKARDGIAAALPTFSAATSNGVLSLGRQLAAYIIAADLIRLSEYAPALDTPFRANLATWRDGQVGTHGLWNKLSVTYGIGSNNWGAHAGTAVVAIDRYLGRPLDADWLIFRGFTGDLAAHTFPKPSTVDASWWCETTWRPVQQCPDGRDGAVTEDAWRSGAYPAISPTYVMDSAQALALQAELLTRAGFPAWPLLTRSAGFLKRNPNLWTTAGGRGGRTLAYWYNARLNLGVSTANVGDRRMWSLAHADWLYGPAS